MANGRGVLPVTDVPKRLPLGFVFIVFRPYVAEPGDMGIKPFDAKGHDPAEHLAVKEPDG